MTAHETVSGFRLRQVRSYIGKVNSRAGKQGQTLNRGPRIRVLVTDCPNRRVLHILAGNEVANRLFVMDCDAAGTCPLPRGLGPKYSRLQAASLGLLVRRRA